MAVERRQLGAQFAQVENLIDATKQVTSRDMVVKTEAVEELVLSFRSPSHHLDAPPTLPTT